ncbi:YebC/PmpR family DNA-binding transcriptional regulator [Candidatus Babela massiliensis]|uniref:Probable transcriptional regulatory protein BABL1_gene_132 n=1 Tax=Candidatus Babela massiliensis TaxID=673862 RepID=V6DHE2_9BACT|nr:YebC/PmpR family DNA-binding transcriptional regulator [Candidatus Babela massiliensis]CDK30997.1 Uncharacterized conserved protein [Candidatus Babela massiliensis]
MAGHSKWSQIKHKKAKEDSKRGKLFTKLIKEISIVARLGGGDPAANAKLRLLLEKAKEINMPQENSVRAIKRGLGQLPGQAYESYTYEGYGPGNIGVIVEVLTDNKNRAIAELRHLFSKKGGIVAENGAVSWMFHRLGVIRIVANNVTEDSLIENLLDYDIKDINIDTENNIATITCDSRVLDEVKQALMDAGYKIDSAEIEWVPENTLSLNKEDEEKAYDFLSALEDLDDVQNVYTNLD